MRWLPLLAAVLLGLAAPPAWAAELLPPPTSKDEFAILRDALNAAARDDHVRAQRIAAQADDPLPLKIVRWLDYRRAETVASFEAISAFILENPEWPELGRLQASAEQALARDATDSAVLAWFEGRDPVTRDGRIRLLHALLNANQQERAGALARTSWRDDDFGAKEEQAFMAEFGRFLSRQDHQARLDRLLWENKSTSARRMFAHVGPGWRALAETRIALHDGSDKATALLRKVPAELKRDPGLTYERVRWRRLKGLEDEARALLVGVKTVTDHAPLWWQERKLLAWSALEKGATRDAYRLAAAHGLSSGVSFADAEWFAGWIALRHRGDPKTALRHFTRLHENVGTQISLSRAAYWAGRAAEAADDDATADAWYRKAAAWPATYYGQLAAARAHQKAAPLFAVAAREAAAREDALTGHELITAARMLALLGEDEYVTPFILRLGDLARGPADHGLVAKIAVDISRPDLSVRAAKRAAAEGYVSVEALYPLAALPLAEADPRLEPALVLALSRQESEFDPRAKSKAGALGLMQLMPTTAQHVAKSKGISVREADLIRSPALNVQLGSAYLANLIDGFGGSYVLALAAYNAGPANVRQWIATNGSPLDIASIDVIDWIELIPYAETRNYVQRVLEGVQVYRWRLGEMADVTGLERDLVRGVAPTVLAARCESAQEKKAARAATLSTVC
ncbi:MAG: lytic transglycosylase domain-containing protein [Alphaproteobacteria bacterium]